MRLFVQAKGRAKYGELQKKVKEASSMYVGGSASITPDGGGDYAPGANISIDDEHVISVTGITSYTGITYTEVTDALGYVPLREVTETDIENALGYLPIGGIIKDDVIGALGYTPYDGSKNPYHFISGIEEADIETALGYIPISGISKTDVTTALGYTPYDATNPNKYISGINSQMVTSALGYTPYDAENPEGYINAIYKNDVVNALQYTPADVNEMRNNYVAKSELDLDMVKDAIGYVPAEAVSQEDKSAKNSEKWGGYNIVVGQPGTARNTIYITI